MKGIRCIVLLAMAVGVLCHGSDVRFGTGPKRSPHRDDGSGEIGHVNGKTPSEGVGFHIAVCAIAVAK